MNKGGVSATSQKDQQIYQTMGLPQIVPNQSLYYNQEYPFRHGSPEGAVIRSALGPYPENNYAPQNIVIQTESGDLGPDARVLMASPIPITAAGFPQNHHKIKKFSRETNYESDFSIIETEGAFPQQPSSGETMDYKYKRSQQQQQMPYETNNGLLSLPQVYANHQQQQQLVAAPVLSNIVNGGGPQQQYLTYQGNQNQQMIPLTKQQMTSFINDQNNSPQYPQQIQQQQRIINNNNSRAQRAAQLTNPTTQLGTVAELYTDTNYSGETNNEGHSQKDISGRKSNSFKEIQPPISQQHTTSQRSKNEGAGGMSPFPSQNKIHRKQVSAVNDMSTGELQINSSLAESPTHSQGMQKSLSQAKRQALKKALDNSGKSYQLLPLISKPMAVLQQTENQDPIAEETKKPNSSKRSMAHQSQHQSFHNEANPVKNNSSTLVDNFTNDSPLSKDIPQKQRLSSNRPSPAMQPDVQEQQDDLMKSELIDDYDQPPTIEEPPKIQEGVDRSKPRSSRPTNSNRSQLNAPEEEEIAAQRHESFVIEEESLSPETIKAKNKDAEPIIPSEEFPQDTELNDLIMLIGAHKTLKKETVETQARSGQRNSGKSRTKRSGQQFRKRKNDMVFRQMTYVHESALMEEVKTFEDDLETKRDPQSLAATIVGTNNGKIQRQQTIEQSNLDKLGLGSLQLLRMIPRIISDSKGDKKNIHRVFVHSQGNTRVKMISLNGDRGNQNFLKRSTSFPKNQTLQTQFKFSQQTNAIIQSKVKELINLQLLEKVNERQKDYSHLKRSNSYDHGLKLGKGFPQLNLKAPESRKLEDIFPNCHQIENNTNKQSNFDDSSRINGLSSNRGGGGGMTHLDHQNSSHQLGIPHAQLHPVATNDQSQMNRYDEGLSSLQSSMEDDHDNNKHYFGSGQGNQKGSMLHAVVSRKQHPLRKIPSVRANKNMGGQGSNAQQAFNNSIFTLGDYKGNLGGNLDLLYPTGPTNGRIISKEKVDDIEELLSQALKSLNITPKQLAIQNKLVNAIKEQFVISVQDEDTQYKESKQGSIIIEKVVEPIGSVKTGSNLQSLILKSTKLQRTIENVKPTLRVNLTQQEEEEMLRDVSQEERILRFQKFFLMPKENGVQIPAVLTGVTPIQKIVDLKSSFIQNSNRKIGTSSQTLNAPTDQNLNELHQAELKVIFVGPNRCYDVLIDSRIFDQSFYFLGVSVADPRKSLFSSQQKPLIIKLRGTIQDADIDAVEDSSEHSTVIINFLRERYLSNFTKYQKHLTQRERPTSRYYNSHQAKELAMLSMTGGFSREHKALPQWKVHNNQELLHFQVAQLRRAYSLWLNRVSMNECIKRTLFQSKNDLLLNNVRHSNNINLTSPQLIEATIDRICQLCYKPEDTYKLNMILGKSTQYQHGQGGLTTMATTGPKTLGNSGLLNQSRSDESHYESVKTSTAQGMDETQADYNDKNESATAIYLHNHPAFITYNQDLEVADNLSIDSFIPMRFRMSTLFGYKTKIVRDGLYEVFEPVADARYLLAIAFKRAFMIKREQRGKYLVPGAAGAGATNATASNVSSLLEVGQQSSRNQKELVPQKFSMRKSEISTDKFGKD